MICAILGRHRPKKDDSTPPSGFSQTFRTQIIFAPHAIEMPAYCCLQSNHRGASRWLKYHATKSLLRLPPRLTRLSLRQLLRIIPLTKRKFGAGVIMYRVTALSRAVFAACLAASFSCLSNQTAQAQGPDRWAGFYVSGHGGLNVPRDTVSEFDSPGLPGGIGTITTDAERGYRVGGALGYFFNRYLSGEVE